MKAFCGAARHFDACRQRARLGRKWPRLASARFYFDLRRAREAMGAGQTPWTPPISILYALDVAPRALSTAKEMTAVWERHDRYARAVRARV